MKDFAQNKSSTKKASRARKNQELPPVPIRLVLILLLIPICLIIISNVVFPNIPKKAKDTATTKDITFTFESDLKDEQFMLELESSMPDTVCNYEIQVETYGQEKYAQETLQKVLDLGFDAYIMDVISRKEGKVFHRVMIRSIKNLSDTNNAREQLIRADFLPLIRTKCSQN